jgi:hypothetical protein
MSAFSRPAATPLKMIRPSEDFVGGFGRHGMNLDAAPDVPGNQTISESQRLSAVAMVPDDPELSGF